MAFNVVTNRRSGPSPTIRMLAGIIATTSIGLVFHVSGAAQIDAPAWSSVVYVSRRLKIVRNPSANHAGSISWRFDSSGTSQFIRGSSANARPNAAAMAPRSFTVAGRAEIVMS